MQTFKKPLSKDDTANRIKAMKSGDFSARESLIESNLRLVAHIVKKYKDVPVEPDDLMSIGTIGLIKAIDSYNENKGSKLASYAARCIENEILMTLRQEKKKKNEVSIYEPIGTDKEGNEIVLMDIISEQKSTTLDSLILKDELSIMPQLILRNLAPREKLIITLRYGLSESAPRTQKEIAGMLNISRSYVSRIEKKALRKLKLALSSYNHTYR